MLDKTAKRSWYRKIKFLSRIIFFPVIIKILEIYELQNSGSSNILITGGTGLLGKKVCSLLLKRGIQYTVATHKKPVEKNMVYLDLASMEGIDSSLLNKQIILHLDSDKKHPRNDVNGTRELLQEIVKHNYKPHLIYISVVSTDRLPKTYLKQKFKVEEEIKKFGISYSILRATQFHEYIDQILKQLLKYSFPILRKKVLVQPTDITVVAERLVNMCFEGPSNAIENIGRREVLTLKEMVDFWLAAKNKRKTVMDMPLCGKTGRSLKGGCLTGEKQTNGGKNWRQWVTDQYVISKG